MKNYYDLTTKDIVNAIKEGDKTFNRMAENDPNILNDVRNSWLLQSSLRNAAIIAKREAKKRFTPFKYRY